MSDTESEPVTEPGAPDETAPTPSLPDEEPGPEPGPGTGPQPDAPAAPRPDPRQPSPGL